jgi:DNA-binding MarR family transcriptional regulator
MQWERRQSGLGILAARLMVGIQNELYTRLAEAGHGQLTHLHGAVIAHLDEGGTRATELAQRSGRHKQVIGRLVDELQQLGYVQRRPEQNDRRAKLVVPTAKGLEVMQIAESVIAEIERRQARRLGKEAWEEFRTNMLGLIEALSRRPPSK